jgi:hypothetical protein
MSRSTVFLTAYDRQQNMTAVHGLRHTYGSGRVLYFAQVSRVSWWVSSSFA